jgi:hypothetical protein
MITVEVKPGLVSCDDSMEIVFQFCLKDRHKLSAIFSP